MSEQLQIRYKIVDDREPPEIGTVRHHKYPSGSIMIEVFSPCCNCGKGRWIARCKTDKPRLCKSCLNKVTKGGIPLSEEHKKKLSLSIKKYKQEHPLTSEQRNKISKGLTGRQLSKESRQKIRDKLKGTHLSLETIDKIRKANIGKRFTPDGTKRLDTQSGYIYVYMPNHPYSNKAGYIFEHRLVVEKRIGHYLSPQERIHHINGIKADNRDENLMICSSKSHRVIEMICKDCSLKKEIRLLRLELKQMKESMQLKFDANEIDRREK